LLLRPAVAAATHERFSRSPSRRYGAISLAPRCLGANAVAASGGGGNGREPRDRIGEWGAGGGDGDLVVGLFTHSVLIPVSKDRVASAGLPLRFRVGAKEKGFACW